MMMGRFAGCRSRYVDLSFINSLSALAATVCLSLSLCLFYLVGLVRCSNPGGRSSSLDRELISRQRVALAADGFGQEVKAALDKRKRALVDAGYVTDLGNGHVRAPKDLIQRLEATDIERAGKALAAERGLQWRPAVPGNYVTGQLVGFTQLSSGRFAMIESFGGDSGLGFSLVPWQPVLDQRIGQHISGLMRNDRGIEWSFGRKRGLGL
jgi:hypothetical protein